MIEGINHITLAVSEVEASFAFYVDVLGFQPAARWPQGAYLLAGETWIALVLDEELEVVERADYTHVAFTCSKEDFPELCRRVEVSGARIWQENWSEGDSLYFVDPIGHKLEIHCSDLRARLQSAKRDPW